ncbi:hypothetical protein LA6_001337 [Marinibacterium anthonyi]|nr:hypothetical protein LA6_001337 [Marinibacterium anthonyi]
MRFPTLAVALSATLLTACTATVPTATGPTPGTNLGDSWGGQGSTRIGKHDFPAGSPQDISFIPRYRNIPACGVSLPVDDARWTIERDARAGGWPTSKVDFRPRDQSGRTPAVLVTFGCGTSAMTPAQKLDALRTGYKGGDGFTAHWGAAQSVTKPGFGTVYYAPRQTIFADGRRVSGIAAYWSLPDGQVAELRTTISEWTDKGDKARQQSWNTDFSRQYLAAITALN